MLGESQRTSAFFCLPDCWLVASMYSVSPVIAYLGIELVFIYFQSNAEIVPKFQVATVCLSRSPPDLNSSKIPPSCRGHQIIWFSNVSISPYINQTIKIPLSLSQAYIPGHSVIFMFVLSLSEHPAGDYRKSSNQVIHFSTPEEKMTLLPIIFFLHLLFYCLS
jgi:hypothetical protein